jgi:hypothetical protein
VDEGKLKFLDWEGREEGAAHGAIVGTIQLLQEIIGGPVSSTPSLLQRGSGALSKQLDELQECLRSRGNSDRFPGLDQFFTYRSCARKNADALKLFSAAHPPLTSDRSAGSGTSRTG